MSNFIVFFLAFVWSIRIIGNILAYVNLWWVKEYRLDRMLIHLKTPQGVRFLIPAWRLPPVSPKTIFLIVFTSILLLILCLALPFHLLINLLIADLLTFPITFVLVFTFSIPTKIYHWLIINQAVSKLETHQPMLVIGITGSYGKTSVKDYLATILSLKYKVLKTEASKNSQIGIAEIVLENLNPNHQIFIAEMGAYKRGEISEMVRMVKPEIGIITSINAQHQDLFGSIENTMKAKYELIAGLIGKRLAILNADDNNVKLMGRWAKRDGLSVWWFSKKKDTRGSKDVFWASDIVSDTQATVFTVHQGISQAQVATKVLGEHQVSNILPAIAAAVSCGMTLQEASAAASAIKPTHKVMQLVPGINGAAFVNDTFNNNPDAAKAALYFLSKNKGKKYLVFQPMIELGNYTEASHEEVGKYAARICDAIILTNNNFYEYFIKGAQKSSPTVSVKVMSANKAADYLKQNLGKGDMVLFKGKEAEHTLKILNKK